MSKENFKYYKVVISKNSSSPKYPDDGYLYYLTDVNNTTAVIDNKTPYNGGDFGKYLTPGQKYFFSVTAVYNDKKIYGNSISLAFPPQSTTNNTAKGYTSPQVSAKTDGSKIILKWQPIYDERLNGYKVVISKYDSSPKYPDNGYLYWITDKNVSSAVIDNSKPYNNGDFGEYLTPGQKYYFSVTAVYKDFKKPGNTIYMEFP